MKNIFHTLLKPIIVVSIVLAIAALAGILFNLIVSLFISTISTHGFVKIFQSDVMIVLCTSMFVFTSIWAMTEIAFTTLNKNQR